MDKIEVLRDKLHVAIDKGDKMEILAISCQLDKLIVEVIKKNIEQ